MYYRIKITYQTTDGLYETRTTDHAAFLRGRDFVIHWALQNLPPFSRIVSHSLEWSKELSETEHLKRVISLLGTPHAPSVTYGGRPVH